MATTGSNLSQDEKDDRARVGRIEAESLSWKNILNTRLQINAAAKEEADFAKTLSKLGQDEKQNAKQYLDVSQKIANTEKEIQRRRALGTVAGDRGAKNLERTLRAQRAEEEKLLKTAGGYFRAQEQAAAKKKESLMTERDLIKDINKERGVGAKFLDIFRSKEQKQKTIDIARAKAGGGPNVGAAAGGGGDGGGADDTMTAALGAAGPYGAAAALAIKAAQALAAPFKAAGKLIKDTITAPFREAAGLVSGGVGIGGGAVSGSGATSLLGGVSDVAKKIPFIGEALGGVIDLFKGVLDFALGVDAANTRIARSLGISKTQAVALKKDFIAIEQASTSIVVNQTRLLESQIELSQQLGVQNTLSGDILSTNIELKEVAGIEVETRKQIAEASIITGRNAKQLTQSVLGQVAAFEGLTGIAFNFRDILGEAAKQTGVLGLQFAKYPEKLTKSLVTVKALGFSLKQVNDIAGGLVDFESSITKEFEAQVLLGRNINLTKAREAALNNDLVTVAAEITKNVGSAGQFLKLNRIQQDAIAESVGMTRDSLADTLKQQEAFTKLGAQDVKQANEKIAALRAQGKSQEEITKMLGEDAYNYITQTGTAEKLVEIMNKIKIAFVEFVEKSGLIEFISNPARLEAFVKGMVSRIAGAVEVIGDIIGGLLDVVSHLPGTDTLKWQTLANTVRGGAGELGAGIRSTAANIDFGAGTDSISGTVEGGTKKNASMNGSKASANTPAPVFNVQNTTIVGTEKWDSQTRSSLSESPGTWAQ
jgi:hypothetical protein